MTTINSFNEQETIVVAGTDVESPKVTEPGKEFVQSAFETLHSDTGDHYEARIDSSRGFGISPLEEKQKKALASAVMDTACMYLLSIFANQGHFDASDLSEIIAEPAGWLKVCMLARADLIEIVGTSARLSSGGVEILRQQEILLQNIRNDNQ